MDDEKLNIRIIATMNFTYILFSLFAFSALVQLLYYLFIFRKVNLFKKKEIGFNKEISVVVCGYNEAENLEVLIPKILDQDYPYFQLVVVNDQSNDDTKMILKKWEYHPRIKIVTITDDIPKRVGKKFALSLGIKAAKYDYLLLTDADCVPVDDQWITSMVSSFSDQTQIVLGYGAYQKKKGLLNMLVRFDTFLVALQYFSYSLLGKTYMGVGRNLAYKKSLFFDNKGFASHLHIPSGDDDLFIREVATEHNTTISIDRSAATISVPKESFFSWIRQKSRHLSTSTEYSFDLKVLLGLFSLTQLMFWFSFIYLMIDSSILYVTLSIFALKTMVQYFIYFPFMKKMEEKDLGYFLLILDLLMILFQVIFGVANIFTKKKRW
jgi:glycosyltransferase involved in cell wall biosynthesis